jgi:hypothetical protein
LFNVIIKELDKMLLSKIFSSKQSWDVTTVGINTDSEKSSYENYNYTNKCMLKQKDQLKQCGCMVENDGEICGCRLVKRLRITGRSGINDVCKTPPHSMSDQLSFCVK